MCFNWTGKLIRSIIIDKTKKEKMKLKLFSCQIRYWLLPGFVLKKMIMDNFSTEAIDPDIADSIDFLVEKVRVADHHGLTCWLYEYCFDLFLSTSFGLLTGPALLRESQRCKTDNAKIYLLFFYGIYRFPIV